MLKTSLSYFFVCNVLGLWMVWGHAAGLEASALPVVHHSLEAILDPELHEIRGVDTVTLPQTLFKHSRVSFHLNSHLMIERLALDGTSVPLSEVSGTFPDSPPTQQEKRTGTASSGKSITIPPKKIHSSSLRLTIEYHGSINDPPQASAGLRFVKPDETSGHIGPEGVYLTSETFWYPVWEGVLNTYDLVLILPEGWEAVTQDKPADRKRENGKNTTRWMIKYPSEALTVAANRFRVETRQWQDIELATYLFPDEAPLAPQYFEAAADYLKLYTSILGPYPFSTFAIVENFFPSGLGMPAFTLLGQAVVRRGYTQPYSLGHEIVHSWFGNSVLNDFSKGNWVEGLTTYLANYYYDEATGNTAEAFNTRRRMHHEYNLYTTPEDDYPVSQFHHKETRRDNAVGYQKTALVFHMLRQEIGDRAFFKGVGQLVTEGTGRYMEWADLERIFSAAAEQDLGWFFKQWVFQPGAPTLEWQNVSWKDDPQSPENAHITGTVTQSNTVYRLTLPVTIEMEGSGRRSTTIPITGASQDLRIQVPANPKRILIDPDNHILRRLKRDQLPPMLNVWETDPIRTLILPLGSGGDEESAYAPLLQRLEHQPGIATQETKRPVFSPSGSYLLVGTTAQEILIRQKDRICPGDVQADSTGVTIGNQTFDSNEMAFLISCPHPDDPGHVLTFFFGLSPEATKPVSRLLFFYGWDSYLVFQKGRVVARGLFDPVHSAHEIILSAP